MQFQQDWPKDEKITAFLNFCRKTEKFRCSSSRSSSSSNSSSRSTSSSSRSRRSSSSSSREKCFIEIFSKIDYKNTLT